MLTRTAPQPNKPLQLTVLAWVEEQRSKAA